MIRKSCVWLFVAMGVAWPLFAERVEVPRLPEPVFADTEVVTNVCLPRLKEGSRFFNFELRLEGTAENNVEVGFGKDGALVDGGLSEEEIGFKIGWDCGRWFVASPKNAVRPEAEALGAGDARRLSGTLALGAQGKVERWVLREGNERLVFEGLEGVPPWLERFDFEMAKVVVRGVGARTASVMVELQGGQFVFIVR